MLKKDYGNEFPIYKNSGEGECIVKNVSEEEYRENLKKDLGASIESRNLDAYIDREVESIKRQKDRDTIGLQKYLP